MNGLEYVFQNNKFHKINDWKYGKKHGLCLEYNNGAIANRTNYIYGKKDGLSIYYNEDMTHKIDQIYKNGVLISSYDYNYLNRGYDAYTAR